MTREIDLADPGVQKLLYGRERSALDVASRKKRLVQQWGDQEHGLSSQTQLDAIKHEILLFYPKMDVWLTVDVYPLAGQPTTVHVICPRCHHSLQISETRKKMEVDLFAPSPLLRSILAHPPADWDREDLEYLRTKGAVGALSIEPFECTWELGPGQLCRWKAAVDKNVVKEA